MGFQMSFQRVSEMRGEKKWFSIDSKSFEISVKCEGRSLKGYTTERRKGAVSWIKFEEEGLNTLFKCIDQCYKEGGNTRRIFEWKENDIYYRVENHRNEAGKYLSCSVIGGEGKKHKIFIPKEKW